MQPEQSTHVPLFSRHHTGGWPVQRVLTMFAELVDILPTLAALARIEIRTSFHHFGDALLNASGDVVDPSASDRPSHSRCGIRCFAVV